MIPNFFEKITQPTIRKNPARCEVEKSLKNRSTIEKMELYLLIVNFSTSILQAPFGKSNPNERKKIF